MRSPSVPGVRRTERRSTTVATTVSTRLSASGEAAGSALGAELAVSVAEDAGSELGEELALGPAGVMMGGGADGEGWPVSEHPDASSAATVHANR